MQVAFSEIKFGSIEKPSILIPAPETVPSSPAVPIKVMLESILPLPIPREPSSMEPVRDGPVRVIIPKIAVTTTCSDQEDVTFVTENKC